MPPWLAVFVGAGLGGLLRHGVNNASLRLLGPAFPWGTLTVNVAGSLAMGLIAGFFASRSNADPVWRLFLLTGVLGGFTTFSAFSLDVAALWERGATGLAALYVVSSLLISIAALFAGLWVARSLFADGAP